MSLFRKKVTQVDSYTMSMVEDTPNYMQQTILTAIRGERSISDDILANMLRSLSIQMDQYYKYGSEEYYYGLPQGGSVQPAVSNTVKLAIMTTLPEGTEIHIDYNLYGKADSDYFAEPYLTHTRKWNRDTDLISNPVLPDPPQTPSQSPTYFTGSYFVSNTVIRLQYINEDKTLVTSEDITVAPIKIDEPYYHCSYFIKDEYGGLGYTRYWWSYAVSDNTFPELTPLDGPKSPYLPVVPLRHDNVDFTVDDGSERYRTSKKLLTKVGLKIGELGDGINENPDVGEIDHAYIIMGIPLQAKNSASLNYLYKYFKHMQSEARYSLSDYIDWDKQSDVEKEDGTPPINIISIKEAGISYDVEIGYHYVHSEIKTGSIGKRGIVTAQYIAGDDVTYNGYIDDRSDMILRKQLSGNQYEQVTIRGLRHVSYIYNAYTVVTRLEDTINSAATDEDSDNFVVPIHHGVFKAMSAVERTEAGYEAIRIGFHTIKVTKLKWYQTEFFKFVVMVVAIVLTIVSLGSLSSSIVWAAGLVGSTSFIVGAVVLASILIGIRYGVMFLVDKLGAEFGIILMVAVAVMGMSGTNLISAEALTVMQSGIQTGMKASLDESMSDIRNEYDALQREMQESEAWLKEAEDELNMTGIISPWAIANSSNGLARPEETPEQYYNTRIHLGNVAPFTFTQISHYVDNTLYLEGLTTHHGIKV